jgi:hypothetical protein
VRRKRKTADRIHHAAWFVRWISRSRAYTCRTDRVCVTQWAVLLRADYHYSGSVTRVGKRRDLRSVDGRSTGVGCGPNPLRGRDARRRSLLCCDDAIATFASGPSRPRPVRRQATAARLVASARAARSLDALHQVRSFDPTHLKNQAARGTADTRR